jgi:hypothetical protein
MICWWCGVEPDSLVEVIQFGGAPLKLIPNWPDGDHLHGETPPSPDDLFDRVMLRPGGAHA